MKNGAMKGNTMGKDAMSGDMMDNGSMAKNN